MRLFYTLTFILFSAFFLYAQWTNQNPVPNGNDLCSVFFVDNDIGWIVGSGGFIKKTTDAGNNWIQQISGTNLSLRSIQFINQTTGWICGDNGLILKTTDGGNDWFEISSGTSALLTDLYFQDNNNGWISGYGGTILKTTNGGTSWNIQLSDTSLNINAIDFSNSYVGYAVGDELEYLKGCILKTTNGGSNWINITPNKSSGNLSIIGAVEFIDEKTGWIGDDDFGSSGRIWKTTDGGETWAQQSISLPQRKVKLRKHKELIYDGYTGIRSIYFKDSKNGYAVAGSRNGWNRMICTTTDGGSTWIRNYYGGEEDGLMSVFVNNSNKGWAVGFSGAIFITGDKGIKWSQILSGNKTSNYNNGDDIYSVYFVDQENGWAVGKRDLELPPAGDVILRTTNGGKIWKTQFFKQASTGPVRSVYFINENNGWATSDNYGILRTTDGGENWNYGSDGINSSVFFINSDTGWATSNKSLMDCGIYKSTDAGLTWIRKSTISSTSVYFIDSNIGWAVGPEGSLLKTADAGETWIDLTGITSVNLNAISFINHTTGICVGDNSTILTTTDGGQNWNYQIGGISEDLKSVSFVNPTTVWITGTNGTILQSTDLGNTWILYSGVTLNNMTSMFFIDENSGWFGGMNGTIIRYQNQILPVELASFYAHTGGNRVTLHWETATELNNLGFEIERRNKKSTWNKIGFVASNGNNSSTQSYAFTDNGPFEGNVYNYRLKEIDNAGNYKYSASVEVELIPEEYKLYQNYPNPFNPLTQIDFTVPQEGRIILKVFDILGNEIKTLVNENKQSGYYKIEFNAGSLPSGIYLVRMEAGNFISTKKMVLIK